MGHDQVTGRNRQPGIGLGADVGTLDQADTGLGNHRGQLHAPALVVLGGSHQPGIAQYGQRLGDFRANNDLAVFETGFVTVTQMVMRGEGLGTHFQRQFDRSIEGIAAMIGITGKFGKALDVQQLVQQKGEIVGIDDLLCHEKVLRVSLKQTGSAKKQNPSRARVRLRVTACNLLRDQTISNRPAAPWPPPMHMVTTTYLTPRRLPSISAWPVRREPVTP